jgi:hypothetical protein
MINTNKLHWVINHKNIVIIISGVLIFKIFSGLYGILNQEVSETLHFGPFYNIVSKWIHWQNNAPMFFAILSIMSVMVLIYVTLFCSDEKKNYSKRSHLLFLIPSIATLFAFRSLYFFADIQNPDEGMILASALNILSDGRIFVATDSTTLGPVCYLLIALFYIFFDFIGLHIDISFFLAHLVNTLLITGTFYYLYKSALLNISLKLARAVMLFYVFYFSFSYFYDIQAYNTEFVFSFFLSICIYLTFRYKKRSNKFDLFASGFICGLMPYIKLQALPMMFACIIWILLNIIIINKQANSTYKLFLMKLSWFCGVILLPTIIIVLYCLTYKSGLSNAYLYYIKNAVAHVGAFPVISSTFMIFLNTEWLNTVFALPCIAFFVLILSHLRITVDLFFSAFLAFMSMFALLRTGSGFHHYFMFITVPFILLLISSLNSCPSNHSVLKHKGKLSVLIISIWLILFGGFYRNVYNSPIIKNKNSLVGNNVNFTNLSTQIQKLTNINDHIVIWGWEFGVYVYTNRRSGTAQGNIERIWGNYPFQNTLNYINDIKINKPKIIVDVVAPGSFGFNDAAQFALEKHPEIWPAIQNDYKLTDALQVEGGAYKIYTRNEFVPIVTHSNE